MNIKVHLGTKYIIFLTCLTSTLIAHTVLLPGVYLLHDLFVLLGHVIQFQKAFDVLNKNARADLLFWASAQICRLHHWGLCGGEQN